jgi:hypothetical protein
MRGKDGRLFSAAHNPKVGGSNPPPATNAIIRLRAALKAQLLSKTVQ